MTKKIISIYLSIVLILQACIPVFAADISTPVGLLASALYNQTQNVEQYKLNINKGAHINSTHVEILPEDSEYWIPKNRQVKITSDCDSGYKQSNNTDVITVDESKQIDLEAVLADKYSITGTVLVGPHLGIGNYISFGCNKGYYYCVTHVCLSDSDRYITSITNGTQLLRLRVRTNSPMTSMYLIKATGTGTMTLYFNESGGFVGVYRLDISENY